MTDEAPSSKKRNLKPVMIGGGLVLAVAVMLGYRLQDTQTLIVNNQSTSMIKVSVYDYSWTIEPETGFKTRFKPQGDGSYSIIDVKKSEEITQVGYLTNGLKSCYNVEIVDANEGPGVVAGGC